MSVIKHWDTKDAGNSVRPPDRQESFATEHPDVPAAESNPSAAGGKQPEGPSVAISSVVIDSKALDTLRALQRPGRPDIVARVVNIYLDSSPQLLRAMQEAVEQGDASALERAAHSLKSSSANIGAMRLAELSKELEAMGRNNTLGVAASLVSSLEGELRGVWDALSVELKRKAA